ncbi:MAG: thiamine pyrophosphate-binding protein [Pseudomonadota bacterium]
MVKKNRGADGVMHALKDHGVDTVFTLSGNHIMSLFDAAVDTGQRLIHTRHEAAAVHMADAYGRLTGKPGIAMATGGPGHANATAGLFTALGADSPMVLLSGHAPTTQIGWGAFQELDQAAMAAPVAKASWMVETAGDLVASIDRAMELATSGRPGPVHVSLPSDLLDGEIAGRDAANADKSSQTLEASADAWQAAARLIKSAERPVLIGGPVFARAEAAAEFHRMAQTIGIPGVIQESPRGLNDPSLGAFADVLAQADLVVLVQKAADFTMRFAQTPHFADDARLIAIGADPAQLALALDRKGDKALKIAADMTASLAGLSRMEGLAAQVNGSWRNAVEAAVAYRPETWSGAQDAKAGTLHPLEMCGAIRDWMSTKSDPILIADGGEIGQWAQATLTARRRVTNSVTGSIGASLPFALAARAVDAEAPIVTIMGDGTVGFHLAEFETAVRCGLPFIAVVGNDANWNAEYQIQVNSYGADRAANCDLTPAPYHDVCRSLGGFGAEVQTTVELTDALVAAEASGLPACINVRLDGRGAPKIQLPK